jgi:hypothetical protein
VLAPKVQNKRESLQQNGFEMLSIAINPNTAVTILDKALPATENEHVEVRHPHFERLAFRRVPLSFENQLLALSPLRHHL